MEELVQAIKLGIKEEVKDAVREEIQTVVKEEIRTVVKEEIQTVVKEEIRTVVKEEIQIEIGDKLNNITNDITIMKSDIDNMKDDIRSIKNTVFLLEHEHGRKIDAIYDLVNLDKEINKPKFDEIPKISKKSDYNALCILNHEKRISNLEDSSLKESNS